MSYPITVRAATLYDIDALVNLLQQLFLLEADFNFNADKQKRGLEKLIMEQIKNKALLLVAETNDSTPSIIGMCSGQTLVSTAEGGTVALIEDVVVDENFRGRGVGKALLKNIEQWVIEQGMTRMQLLADRDNRNAIDFYQNNNWQATQLISLRKLIN